ncbi:PREDICTED: SWI/SNF complex subunit SWI3B [Tarenaya hassleriana]|uniref:SWI/SNF complex subunit SWI3B n=1 Tax=Tarenaya hassleriana TaxID=28532 RepID=UPI00053C3D59|nr:PREDICTED: SWI/SNF complex subunit SWI3B [Tarenaya hassleriana]
MATTLPDSAGPKPETGLISGTGPAGLETPPGKSMVVPPSPSPSSDTDLIYVPSYSRWFSWNGVHECEVRSLPEFFDSRSPSKNSRVYMYLRNSIVKQYRENRPRRISFTDVRRTLVGDVGSIRRIFDFLELWGLVNYTSSVSAKPLKWDEKEIGKSAGDAAIDSPAPIKESAKRICNGCKGVCSIACFSCDKYDLTLCARCYVRGNYRVGVNSSEFKRVEISDDAKAEWSEKEILQLLEAIMHYGDEWRKVAQHVTGRTEKDCVSQFLKLPFGEEYVNRSDSGEADETLDQVKGSASAESEGRGQDVSSPNKRLRLTPLADASNPIMAQAAFLSALAGSDVAEAAAQAAVTALSDSDYEADKGTAEDSRPQEVNGALNGETTGHDSGRALSNAKSLLEKEEDELERAIKEIVEVKMKNIRDRIIHFENLDLKMEKSRKQLEHMKNLLFADQLNIFFHTRRTRKTEDIE